VVYSAGGSDKLLRQAMRFAIGISLLVAIAQLPPRLLKAWSPVLYVIGIILLIVVDVVGHVGKGAQRWLDLGFMRFQPSELMKLAVPMMLAWYFSERALPPRSSQLMIAGGIIAVPVALTAVQPDLGTALLIAAAGFFVLWFAGLSWKLMVGLITAAAPLSWLLWHFYMVDYQRNRVLTFLNPESDPLGKGYHIIQSKIAIGSGGLYGKGYFQGTQSQLEFVPERHTDFIFAVLGEELGFLGALMLLLLFGFIIARGLMIATQAQETYTRLLAGSLTLSFFVYVFVNVGMVTGLLPVVGVPLPLVSYGGTASVTLLAGFGMVMSLHTHRRLLTT
jgi:rod shape determining protein RodA